MKFYRKWIKKAEPSQVQSKPLDPGNIPPPQDAQGYLNRGVVFYARRQYEQAIQDLLQAASLDASLVDPHYCLGMAYKASQQNSEAIQAFQQALAQLEKQTILRAEAKTMLRRLALAHINEIQTGNWNLEKEIWRHIP